MSFKSFQILFLILILLKISTHLFAENQDFRFTHLTTDNGLSQSNITTILQDSKGFMWFGTFNGLNRYDGYNFEHFHYHADSNHTLSQNFISALLEDKNGSLWVGTSDGLNRYDRQSNQFKSYKHSNEKPGSISNNPIEAIVQDSKGRIWIGTRLGGLELYDAEGDSFIHHVHDENNPNSLSSNAIRELFEDSDGNLWIAHWTGGIDLLADNNTAFKPVLIDGKKLTDVPITAIVESGDKNIWIATQGDGLFCLKKENGKVVQIAHYTARESETNNISSNIILCLLIDRFNNLWIGTEDKGITILDLKTDTFQHISHDPYDPSGLNHNSIWKIYEDRSENIWIGTYAYGLNLLTDRKTHFRHFKYHPGKNNGLNNNMINAFVQDQDNNLWIATDGGGLNFFDRENNRFEHYTTDNSGIGSNVVVSLLDDSRNRLWVGTWSDGLYQFDKKSNKFVRHSYEKSGLGSDRILHLTEANDGGLWISTYWGGLTYLNIDKSLVTIYNAENSGLTNNYVRVSFQDNEGNLWIGTDFGLEFYNPETNEFIAYKHNEHDEKSLSKGFIHCIVQTSDSSIWIGATGGLNKFDKEMQGFMHFDTEDGLPNDEIKCIIEDRDGNLWLSTNKGISQFNIRSETFKNYDVSDGLQGNEFNIRSGLITSKEEIIFGGNNGFNIFNYPITKRNTYIPPVVLTDFRIFNKTIPVGSQHPILQKQISETKKMVLSSAQKVISFDFVALNYISPEKNQYAYIMEGFETDWNYVGTRRTATYTNLDPGDYVFRVKASNNDGLWNEEGVSLKITIEPPFWASWWAYLLAALLIIAVTSFVINYFISRQRLKNALKMEHLELEKMYEMDQAKTQFFTNIAHEFNSPITLILSPLEKLITSRSADLAVKNSLRLIYKNAKRLQRMTNQLKDFQKMETGDLQLNLSRGNIISFIEDIVNSFMDYATERRISLNFETDEEKLIKWFDPDKLDKIIYNLLSNAFKFTPNEGWVRIRLTSVYPDQSEAMNQLENKAKQYLGIRVTDNGIGIPEDKINRIFERYYHMEKFNGKHYEGSGVGLAFVNELVNIYGGEISVTSDEGKGTEFTVYIPLDEQYLEENQLVADFNITNVNKEEILQYESQESETNRVQISQHSHASMIDIPVILVVDDDKEIRDYLESILEMKYRIISADNGQKGIKKAFKTIPDLIISDVKMPEMGGTDLCIKIKNDERTSHIPIILLTAHSAPEQKVEGINVGADVYLTKPFNVDELEAHITNLLQSRRRLKTKFSHRLITDQSTGNLSNIDEQFLLRTTKAIEKHMADTKLNADILGKEVGMSRMQLYRKVRGLTNQTVNELIRNIRLKKAVELLKDNRMSVTEVAFEVGFNDLTYFARSFKKKYKISPSEYTSKRN